MYIILLCVALAEGVKIGTLWPSGNNELIRSVQSAVSQFQTQNPQMSVDIVTRSENDASNSGAYQALCSNIADGGFVGFLGPLGSESVTFSAQGATQHHVPLVSPDAKQPLNGESDKSNSLYFRRISPTILQDTEAVSKFLTLENFNDLRSAVASLPGYEEEANALFASFAVRDTHKFTYKINPSDPGATFGRFETDLVQLVVFVGGGKAGEEFLTAAATHTTAMSEKRIWFLTPTSSESVTNALLPKMKGVMAVRPKYSEYDQSHRAAWKQATQLTDMDLYTYEGIVSARTYDATWLLLSSALRSGADVRPTVSNTQCVSSDTFWNDGASMLDAMDKTSFLGASSRVSGNGVTPQYSLQNAMVNSGGDVYFALIGDYSSANSSGAATLRGSPTPVYRGSQRPSPNDLIKGQHLNIVFIKYPPFVFMQNGKHVGFVVELIKELSKRLEFTYTATYWETGKWQAGVEAVQKGDFDLLASDAGITRKREAMVDFAQPYMETQSVLMIRRPSESWSMWRFLEPFSAGVWIALGCTIFISAFIFWALERGCLATEVADRGYGESYIPEKTSHAVENSIWFVCTAMVQLHVSEPITRAGRVMGLGLHWLALLTIATYTAQLAAYLSSRPGIYPIDSIQQVIDDNTLATSIGIIPDTANAHWFESTIGSNFFQIKSGDGDKETLKAEIVATMQDSIWAEWYTGVPYAPPEGECNGDTPVTAASEATLGRGASLLAETERFAQMLKGAGGTVTTGGTVSRAKQAPVDMCTLRGECVFQLRGEGFHTRGVGLPVQKGSPYLDALSQEILLLREEGWVIAEKTRWWTGSCEAVEEVEENQRLGLKSFSGVLVLCGGVWALAFVIRFVTLCIRGRATPKEDAAEVEAAVPQPLPAVNEVNVRATQPFVHAQPAYRKEVPSGSSSEESSAFRDSTYNPTIVPADYRIDTHPVKQVRRQVPLLPPQQGPGVPTKGEDFPLSRTTIV